MEVVWPIEAVEILLQAGGGHQVFSAGRRPLRLLHGGGAWRREEVLGLQQGDLLGILQTVPLKTLLRSNSQTQAVQTLLRPGVCQIVQPREGRSPDDGEVGADGQHEAAATFQLSQLHRRCPGAGVKQ